LGGQSDETTIRRGKPILVADGDPGMVYYFERDGEGGFLGYTDDGEKWIALNLGYRVCSYAASLHPKCLVLWLNYVTLHELTHWATESEDGHNNWLRFLMELLIDLEG
jgi:hypothetical protein